ncbi:TetR/AcrR family transcriptional regulator, partial [Streptomyces sp. NPDC053720]
MEPRTGKPAAAAKGKQTDSGRPRPSLSTRLIVEACLALMDAEGADALTFRRVGAQLGADPAARNPQFPHNEDQEQAVAD